MASFPGPEPTLLGVLDGELDESKYRTSFVTNKAGGLPDPMPGLPRASPRCGRCSAALVHVLQAYCPLGGSPYHRSLQLFACPAAGCAGRPDAWTALRSQSLALDGEGDGAAPEADPPSAADWCDSADDWGVDDDAGGDRDRGADKPAPHQQKVPEDGIGSRMDALHLAEAPPDGPALRPFFISVLDERDARERDDEDEEERRHARRLLTDYERREGALAAQPDAGERYEKGRARHGDRSFAKFRKRISACPRQILRYCRGGAPLLMSEAAPEERPAPCASCGGPRTFELQLMPALVALLGWADGDEERPRPEFGTVLVYTCARSCWTPSRRRPVGELCVVQMDPDQRLFK